MFWFFLVMTIGGMIILAITQCIFMAKNIMRTNAKKWQRKLRKRRFVLKNEKILSQNRPDLNKVDNFFKNNMRRKRLKQR
mmetsp:Transcript_30904/g.37734  ORF Transcript_30904/g.37734 Transcript_30904/m.37734 type:complete len:80 (+) Transcript_30904:67-306(+)